MIQIGKFSKLCRTTVKTLRYYDEIDILKPVFINQENGYRFYDISQLEKIALIKQFKNMGFSLDEISKLLKKEYSISKVIQIMFDKQFEIKNNIDSEKNKLTKINSYINNLKEGSKMSKIVLKELPEVIVASMRVTIPNYNALFEIVPPMGDKMRKHGAVCSEPAYCFNIYHDGEYKEENIDVEVCEAVEEKLKDADGIIYKLITGYKKAASIYHKGPYETLSKSYSEILKWIEENGYSAIDNPRESYIDGIWNKENSEDWLTEIQIPIR